MAADAAMADTRYLGLDFGPDELSAVMRQACAEIIDFVTTPEFRKLHSQLMRLPGGDRPAFVSNIIARPEELARRGIQVPKGMLIETSPAADAALFAVKKY